MARKKKAEPKGSAGRKELPADQKRSTVKAFWVNQHELAEIEKACEEDGLLAATYVRTAVLAYTRGQRRKPAK